MPRFLGDYDSPWEGIRMRPKSRYALIVAAALAIVFTTSAAHALLTITTTRNSSNFVPFGDFITVDISVAYDGAPAGLTGVFSSVLWDPAVLSFQSATPAPFAIFSGPNGFLSKLADPRSFPGDPTGSLRTIQYGATPVQSGSASTDTLITTLTFQVVGFGPLMISGGLLPADGFFGAGGVPLDPSDVLFVNVPEPGTAVVFGLGLMGLGFWRRGTPST